VRAGGEAAVESDSEKTLEDAARVRQLDAEIEYLRSLLSAADQAVGAMEHDTAVKNAIYQASAAVNAHSTTSLDNACVTLSSLLLSTGADVTQSDLDALMAERRQLSAETNEGVITAPAAGVFTAAVDGLESLTPDRLDDLTPADVRGLSKQQESVSKDAFGKLITAKKWYYAAVMRSEDAARLTVGAETTLDFGRHSADALRATVKSISEPVNGEVAVVFTVKSGLAETAALRETGCEIVFSSHTGLRVPVRAIRFIDGEKGKVPVVYVITAERMEMKYVEILYRSDDFVILDRGTGKNALRAGNEVNDAIFRCKNAQEQDTLYQRLLTTQSESYQGTCELMKKGKASYLEVLTAQENYLKAQLADVTNRYNGLISLIDLYVALGGGTK
jgi:hypothetical protein